MSFGVPQRMSLGVPLGVRQRRISLNMADNDYQPLSCAMSAMRYMIAIHECRCGFKRTAGTEGDMTGRRLE